MQEAVQRKIKRLMVGREAGHTRGYSGYPVVALVSGYNLLFLRKTAQIIVIPRNFYLSVVCFRA